MRIRALFLILFIYSTLTISQTKSETKIKDFFWETNVSSKITDEIPDKWKNESAVIIYKNVNYDFHKFGKSVTYKSSIRKRIKLLDMAAVTEFSEFSYNKRFISSKGKYTSKEKGENIIGVKVVKSNGKEIEIDVKKDEVEIDGETKIAIPNLEVGDIIDYYFYKEEPFKSSGAVGFDPVELTLGEEYPIINFKLFFETENDFFINFNSFNGAPDLKEIPTLKNNFRQYELTASDIEKTDFSRWIYPLVEVPSYKFQVYFARSGSIENRTHAFLSEKESVITNSVSEEDVLNLYSDGAYHFLSGSKTKGIRKYFKEKTFKNDIDKITEAYFYMRHNYFTLYIEAIVAQEAKLNVSPFLYGPYPIIVIEHELFMNHFRDFLEYHKIPYEIILAKNRYDGNMDDLLIAKNLNKIFKVNIEKPIYIDSYGVHSNINEISSGVEGTNAYLLSKTKNKFDAIEVVRLPVSNCEQNNTTKKITINIEKDFLDFSLFISNSYNGHSKKQEQKERLVFSDYVYEDYEKYKTESFIEKIKGKKNKAKLSNELNSLIYKLNENQKEEFKKSIKNELGFSDIEDYEYKITNTGRYGLDTYFKFDEKFKVKNALIKKAGNNYIIEIGKLIGGQFNPDDKQRKRKENIYMEYPRTFNHEIKLVIPEGYIVVGLDKLQKSINNATGSFISTAKVENNVLFITTEKQYKNNYEPNSNWVLLVNMLDQAHQFTNEKILIKKQ